MLVITGLSPNGDTASLRSALTEAGFSLDPLQIIEPGDSDESVAHGIAGADILTSDGGTGVPGINNTNTLQVFFRNESISDRLGDLKIPDSELDNYVEALQRGRTVVAYFVKPEAMDQVEGIFRSAQLLNVRRY
jgi:hypothetical protein